MVKPGKNIVFYFFSLLYGGVTTVRNFLFDKKVLRSVKFSIPIISVGNLAVGGTGKTPHIEMLLKILGKKYRTAVLSRGYKRETKGFVLGENNVNAEQIGDEPFQIFTKFPEAVVAVDEKRVRGVEKLLQLLPEIDVILLDDAFQHRYITPGLNILLTDYRLLFSEDHMLPFGTLREYPANSRRADVVIVTKCPEGEIFESEDFRKRLKLLPNQELYFSTFEYGMIYPVFKKNSIVPKINRETTVFVVTGIENPEPMYRYLETFTDNIVEFSFPDHHNFTDRELSEIENKFKETKGQKIIVTTEKDAARLKSHSQITKVIENNIFALPLEVKILNGDKEKLLKNIHDYVRKNSTNG